MSPTPARRWSVPRFPSAHPNLAPETSWQGLERRLATSGKIIRVAPSLHLNRHTPALSLCAIADEPEVHDLAQHDHAGLFLIEHAGGQVDLAVLQFLRSTVRSFSIYPNGDPFDVFLALHQRRDFSYASGCPFAPDGVVARQWKNERPIRVEAAHSFALGPD